MPPIRKTASTPRGGMIRVPSQKQRQPTATPQNSSEDDEPDILSNSDDDGKQSRGQNPDEEGDDDFIDMDGGFDDDPMSTFGGDPNYNQAVAKGQYIRVHFIKPLRTHVDNSTLFPDTKATLKIFAEGLFDKTQVLAKRRNLKLAEIEMEIMIAQMRIGFHPSDVDNPDLANIINLMKNMYVSFISRSEGGWERELDNRIETSHTQHMADDRYRQPMGGSQKSQYSLFNPRRWF